TLVPVFVHHFEEDDETGPSAIVTVMTVMLVALTVVGMIAAPLILRLYTSTVEGGTAADQREVGTALLRLSMPQMLFYGLTALAAGCTTGGAPRRARWHDCRDGPLATSSPPRRRRWSSCCSPTSATVACRRTRWRSCSSSSRPPSWRCR